MRSIIFFKEHPWYTSVLLVSNYYHCAPWMVLLTHTVQIHPHMQLHRHENRFIKIVATICFLYTPMKITMDETTGLRRSTNLKTNEEKWQLRVMRRSSALLSVVLKINIDTLLYPESSRCCATPLAHCIFILDQNTQIWICNSEAWSIMTQWQRQRLHSVELSINRGGGLPL